jgi:predicted dehydrogenase
MQKIGIGIIGTGFAADLHARCYRQMQDLGVQIVIVAARQASIAETFASRHGIPTACGDYRKVLEREDVHIVDLCVPNYLHKPMAIEAAQAGKHIICEKPLTGFFGNGQEINAGAAPGELMFREALRNASDMIAAAEQHQVLLMYAENWLYSPVIRKVESLIEASEGNILEIRGEEAHSGSHSRYSKEWQYSGGGALLRLGCHPIAVGLYLKAREGLRKSGAPIRVESLYAEVGHLGHLARSENEEAWLVHDWLDVENWALLLLTFTDGSRGIFYASDIALGGMTDTLQIRLSNARIEADLTHSTFLRAYAPSPSVFANVYLQEKLETTAGWSHPSVDEEWMLGYQQELRDFVEAVLYQRPPRVDGKLGREVVNIIYAAYLSAEKGQRVYLRDLPTL